MALTVIGTVRFKTETVSLSKGQRFPITVLGSQLSTNRFVLAKLLTTLTTRSTSPVDQPSTTASPDRAFIAFAQTLLRICD